jgi:hypothetical protein
MKNTRNTLLITSILIMGIIWAFIALEKGTHIFRGLDLFIFALIIIIAAVALIRALKKDKEHKAGIPAEDELTYKIKYKAGYIAYRASMYMWLFIFLLKDKFPSIEAMLGGGILLSAVISVIANIVTKRRFNAEQN